MKALVTVSSRHGGTEGIGSVIAETLRSAGVEVDMIAPEAASSLEQYDAIIVGSAVYMGRWLGPARDLVKSRADELRTRPVWLFSSGPVTGVDDPADGAEGTRLLKLVEGQEHRVFAGRLERDGLGFTERTIVRMIRSPWGDHRPWEAIRTWAAGIATAIVAAPTRSS